MNELLKLIEKDARLTPEMLAAMLDRDAGEVRAMIDGYEKDGTIVGYNALIDWEKTGREDVTALIELKITPQRDLGFDRVAERIYNYPEVQSLYLMSGGFDLCVVIEGRTMREVALFVAEKLAPMESVISTATHFVLRKYKDKGLIMKRGDADIRSELSDGLQ
ncbi:MAG: Lrp/AsnC family transcriptional regulator [Clostridia bacterium]|nr:Lrp/AsnC family transcriptional regulator [Clostridia bacterium]